MCMIIIRVYFLHYDFVVYIYIFIYLHISESGGPDVVPPFLRLRPLPALPDAAQAAVHAGQQNQQLEDQNHGGHHQTQHVAWRGPPLVGGGAQELVPAVQVSVRRAYDQSQVTELGLGEEGRHSR